MGEGYVGDGQCCLVFKTCHGRFAKHLDILFQISDSIEVMMFLSLT